MRSTHPNISLTPTPRPQFLALVLNSGKEIRLQLQPHT